MNAPLRSVHNLLQWYIDRFLLQGQRSTMYLNLKLNNLTLLRYCNGVVGEGAAGQALQLMHENADAEEYE